MMASLGVSAASGVAGFFGQQQQEIQNRHSAIDAMRVQNTQTNIGIQQQEAKDSLDAQDTQRQMIQASATARASAGESGTSGNSVDALFNDYHATEGRYFNALATQDAWNRSQGTMDKLGQKSQAIRQINSVQKPSIIGTALKIAGGGMDSYNSTFGRFAKP